MQRFKKVVLLGSCIAIFAVTVASSQPRWEPFPAAQTVQAAAVVVPASLNADVAEGYGTLNAAPASSPAAFSLEDMRRRAVMPPELPAAAQWVLAALTLALFASAMRMLAGLARPSRA